jgi:hypothetical protein
MSAGVTSASRRIRSIAWYMPACVASTVPSLGAVQLYAASVPVHASALIPLFAVPILVTVVAAFLVARLQGPAPVKGTALALAVLLANSYPQVSLRAELAGTADRALGLATLVVVGVALYRLVVKRPEILASAAPLAAVGAVLFTAYAGYWMVRHLSVREPVPIVDAGGNAPHLAGSRTPDIIHVVFDGLGRLDWLAKDYAIDAGAARGRLEAAGLRISPAAVANYSQTFPAVGAMLAMQYVDPAAANLRPGQARAYSQEVIARSSVIRALRDRGYRFTLLSSGYEALVDHPLADDGLRGPTWFGQLEAYVLPQTPFRLLPLQRLSHVPHRRRTREILEALAAFTPGDRPRFVLAHVLAPHPPFVLGPDGSPRVPPRLFSIQDGSTFHGTPDEYRRGYSDQARYVLARVETMARAWARLPRPPVVIINGDHGPGLGFDMRDPASGPTDARMSVFLAMAGLEGELPRSPVNIYRRLFAEVFGVDTPPLDDRSFVSAWNDPFRLQPVAVSPPSGDSR